MPDAKVNGDVMLLMNHGGSLWSSVARGVVDVLRAAGLRFFFRTDGKLDGVTRNETLLGVIARVRSPEQVGPLTNLMAAGLPVVNLSNLIDGLPFPRVGPDDRAVGALGARHLAELGLSRFAYFGDSSPMSRGRAAGFAAALPGRQVQVVISQSGQDAYTPVLREIAADQGGSTVGVMCCNDDRADATMERCRLVGLKVPDRVAVLGVDNDDLVGLRCAVPLSSIELPAYGIGHAAATLLLDLMRGKPALTAPILLPPARVVPRQSTSLDAVTDPLLQTALRFIHDNADKNLSVDDVVTGVGGIARRTLEGRFRDRLQRGIQEEIRRAHLDRARALLADPALSIAEVARLSGFSSQQWFANVFREELDMTPLEYRLGIGGKRSDG